MSEERQEAVIVGALRTPIGRFNGSLASFSAVELISQTGLLTEVLTRSHLEGTEVNEVIIGNVLGAGLGQNVARQVAIKGGLPTSVPALTVNRVCASSLTALTLATQMIRLGEAQVVLAGGTESMSNAPYVQARHARQNLGHLELTDTLIRDGLWDAFYDCHMGMTAENIVEQWKLTRTDQDKFAVHSHEKAVAAHSGGHFQSEMVPVKVQLRKETKTLEADEGPRAHTSLETVASLKPVFKSDGSVTAANSASINDGAALLAVTSLAYAQKHQLPILAKVLGSATVGVDPRIMGHAPYAALLELCETTGVALSDIGLFELNEAFAAQSLAVIQDLKLAPERVNVQGGAIALGHPIGASGARIVVTLLHAMERLQKPLGAASLCVGGGQGVAMLFEKV